jgi:hypothetical protein
MYLVTAILAPRQQPWWSSIQWVHLIFLLFVNLTFNVQSYFACTQIIHSPLLSSCRIHVGSSPKKIVELWRPLLFLCSRWLIVKLSWLWEFLLKSQGEWRPPPHSFSQSVFPFNNLYDCWWCMRWVGIWLKLLEMDGHGLIISETDGTPGDIQWARHHCARSSKASLKGVCARTMAGLSVPAAPNPEPRIPNPDSRQRNPKYFVRGDAAKFYNTTIMNSISKVLVCFFCLCILTCMTWMGISESAAGNDWDGWALADHSRNGWSLLNNYKKQGDFLTLCRPTSTPSERNAKQRHTATPTKETRDSHEQHQDHRALYDSSPRISVLTQC